MGKYLCQVSCGRADELRARSIAYLASGRPVLAQETGFHERLPTGRGLLAFRDVREAVEGAAEINGNYQRHSRAARELAEAFFDSRKCLTGLLAVATDEA